MKNLVYSGSFDPLTYGHLDIIKRAAKIGTVHVLVARNMLKQSLIPHDLRVSLIEDTLQSIGVTAYVLSTDLATVDYLEQIDDGVLIRGVRDSIDWQMESRLDSMNKGIYQEAETVFLQASPQYRHISSSYAKELHRLSKSLNEVCPPSVVSFLSGQ